MPEIDLPPHQWKSVDNRPKPKERILGHGWPIGVMVGVGILIAAFFADGGGHVPIWAAITASVISYAVFAVITGVRR